MLGHADHKRLHVAPLLPRIDAVFERSQAGTAPALYVRMPKLRRSLGVLAITLSLAGCAVEAGGAPPIDDDSDLPTLSGLDPVLQDAPPNSMLPEEGKADAVYPAQFDLVADQSPVRNQAHRGVCSIFGTVALMENLYIKSGILPDADFSEQYLQWSVKAQLHEFTGTGGSSASVNLRAIRQFGIPLESAWPYEPDAWSSADDPACTSDEGDNLPYRCYTNGEAPQSAQMSTLYHLPAGRFINSSVRSLKAQMFGKRAGVVVGGTFFYQAWNHGGSPLPVSADYMRNGYILYPNATDRMRSLEHRAGHSFLLVGWDDNLEVARHDAEGNVVMENGRPSMEKGFFLFKNSWGTTRFGVANPHGAGYGWISYRYITEYMSAYASDEPTAPARTEICDNTTDDDGDHRIDCMDTDCRTAAACQTTTVVTSTDNNTTSTAIPDDDATGISSAVTVAENGSIASISVHVKITHTYRGDLVIKLVHPSGQSFTLQDQIGGAEDNVDRTFDVSAFAGLAANGSWHLAVVDTAGQDTGTLDEWSLTITRAAH